MNKRQQARFDAGGRTSVFGKAHNADFPPRVTQAGQPGPSAAQKYWTELDSVLAEIKARFVKQTDGSYHQGATDKGTLRSAVLLDCQRINATAQIVANEKNNPGLMDRFRMPDAHNDANIVARATAFGTAITELSLEDDFIDHEHAETFLADLATHVADFETADDTKEEALQGQAGSTSSLADLIKRLVELIDALDVCVRNKFSNNAQIIGEWSTASHIERTTAKKPEGTTPANPA